MADFTRNMASDAAADNPGINMGVSGSMHEIDWGTDELYWQENYASRPYAQADRGFDHYRPAYRFGHEAARRHQGRKWEDVEPELAREWDEARGESGSTWDAVKDPIRDAWDRITGMFSGIDWQHRETGLGGAEELRKHVK